MLKIDHDGEAVDLASGPSSAEELLTAENVSLRLLLTQAELSAETLLTQAGIDAKEREAADKLQKLILEELHHRIKNTLATVGAIASQSLRNASSTQHAQQAIEGRLLALGRAHDLLLQARWTSADMRKIVRGAVEAFDNPDVAKFFIEGPDVQIASSAVIAIAMTLNELCTNTTKFGALSVPAGRVAISWVVDEAKRLQFAWREYGGPKVHVPTRQSFGTRLIENLGRQLKGNVKLTYEPSGFVYVLDVPLAALEFSPIG
ncbi:histidine kinase [Afipia sp. Root123D2]|uniref:sensor histidine kinase n=1 Tax=Afipia sp. Root123D2 TaxID=1736436 RepID=UPI0006F7947C|nr:sensor histidine kinase [Afipia sp. Root123D2]KQW20641.1 histidine kinase [Afipia sp. Root123D2]